jgi:hypothetical protein
MRCKLVKRIEYVMTNSLKCNDEPNELLNMGDAEAFVVALTGDPSARMTFQTFPEGGPSSVGPRVLHGTLNACWSKLAILNSAGHGVFAMVNEGDLRGRKTQNVLAVRALFTDDDGGQALDAQALEAAPPSLIVQSAHGRHTYWCLAAPETLDRFEEAQKALARHFGTDPAVHDLPRVMRLPGLLHLKDRGNPFLVKVLSSTSVRYTVEQVLSAYALRVPGENAGLEQEATPSAAAESPQKDGVALRRARAYLAKVDGAKKGEHGDDRTYWVACVLVNDFGLALEDALRVLSEWNRKCEPPWEEADLREKLDSARKYSTGEEGAKLGEEPGDWEPTEDLCFVIPHERYYFRKNGQWEAASPLSATAAKKFLRSRGRSGSNMANVIGHDLLPIATSVDCSPGKPVLFEQGGSLVLNSYQPPDLIAEAGEYPRIKAIIEVLTAGDSGGGEWLFNWMAAKYQRPGRPSGTAPVVSGCPRTWQDNAWACLR